ncbi:MAG: hypothetical protein PVH96_13245, partial [Gemmatimonadota bacterium]
MKPRAWLAALARVVVPAHEREIVLGDLEELYAHRAADRGRLSADVDYLRSALLSAWILRTRRRAVGSALVRPSWVESRRGIP